MRSTKTKTIIINGRHKTPISNGIQCTQRAAACQKTFVLKICTKVSKRFEIRKAPIVAELYVRKLKYWSNTNFKQMLSLASLKLHDIYITMHILLCLVCKRRICVM